MNLKEKIQKDLFLAMKEKKEIEVSVLRLLLNSIFNKEKEKRYRIAKENPEIEKENLEKKSQLSEEEILKVIHSEIKKRKEAIFQFEKGKREDLLEKEKKEIEILKRYLPEQLSQKDIEKMAKEEIEKIGAKSLKDMGKVMASLMPKIKGRAEDSLVAEIVKRLLS
jgi:uncharacterized protein YqeY